MRRPDLGFLPKNLCHCFSAVHITYCHRRCMEIITVLKRFPRYEGMYTTGKGQIIKLTLSYIKTDVLSCYT